MQFHISRHWLVALTLCGLTAASMGLGVNCTGVFYTPVSDDLGIGRGTFAATASISTFFMAASSIVTPRIVSDKNFKRCMIFGVMLTAAGMALMSVSSKLWQFYLLSAARGIGMGFFSLVIVTLVINRWFISRNGLVTGITTCFSGVSGALCSPIFTALIERTGWRMSYLLMGALLLVLCLPAMLLPYSLGPQSSGLEPYRDGSETKKKEKKASRETKAQYSLMAVLLLLSVSLLTGGITAFTQHFPGVAEELGYSISVGALMLSAGQLGNMVSKFVIGVLNDRFNAAVAFFSIMGANLAGILLLIAVRSPISAIAAAFLIGTIYSTAGIGLSFLCRQTVGDAYYAKVFPLLNFCSNGGCALLLAGYGFIYDVAGNYTPALAALLAMCLLTLLLTAVVVRRKGSAAKTV